MAPLSRAARLLRCAVGRLRLPPPARAFSSAAAATETGAGNGREAVIAAAAVAMAGSGLGLWLKPPSLADSGEAPGGQISVTCAASTEAQEEKGRFLFAVTACARSSCRRVPLLLVLIACLLELRPTHSAEEYSLTMRRGYGFSALLRSYLCCFDRYIFFVTLLSIPESHFTAAFKMFDVDHSGVIDREEFKKVMSLMRSFNRQGSTHKDGLRIGLKVGQPVENGGVVEYFFGSDGNEPLHCVRFSNFLKELHDEIIRLEFSHYDVKSSKTIPAKDFALSMVASADMNHINKLLDRADGLVKEPDLKDIRITFEEFKAFADLRQRLEPLSMAIFAHGKVNGLLTKEDLKRATQHVCGVNLTDRVVDIIFHVFDTNQDGNLSSEEFLRALERRETAIRQPTIPGPWGFLSCWFSGRKCSLKQVVL
ncbi:calcium-binding EF hand family protein [Zea mays]|uniref:Calcium-binding EF hand family protein n=1 Tax=Zea mays TaxID=4577 RepID=A0A1D6J9N7_MAIZE|nr:calcium-binding EF hand family protein [Zea mays]